MSREGHGPTLFAGLSKREPAASWSNSTLTFAVYRNGEPIGRHTLAFQHSGPDLTVSTAIDFAVKVLGFTAYRYSHRGQEIWKGDTFQSAAIQTDDNGTKYTVRAQRIDNGINVQRTSGREVMPGGTLSTSHWNVRQMSTPRAACRRMSRSRRSAARR
jgi:hypothetical protein